MIARSTTRALVAAFAALVSIGPNADRAENREAAPGYVAPPQALKGGGVDCTGPAVIVASPVNPYSDLGNSCGGPVAVTQYRNATCNTVTYPGPEQIYRIDLPSNSPLTFTLTPAQADLGLFMVTDCSDPTSCIDFHDAIGGGSISMLPRLATGTYPAGTYYLYVDSYYGSGPLSCGDYTFEVGGIPVELMRFTVE